MVSQLETVPGIGPKKRKALLKAFDNSIDAIREASVEQLTAIPGINHELALAIKELL
jgi:excinuclease ABC subunit C